MSEADVQFWWTLGWSVGGVVVLVIAAVLVAILLAARRIASLAGTTLAVAGKIEAETRPIWALGPVNETLGDIVKSVQSIDARTRTIADALSKGGA